MNCRDAEGELARLHDGLLDDERARLLREHVEGCAECREIDRSIVFSRSMLAQLSPAEMSERDRESARAAIVAAAARPRWSWRRWASIAAAIVIVAIAGVLFRPRVSFAAPPAKPRSIERSKPTAVFLIDGKRVALTVAPIAAVADPPAEHRFVKVLELRRTAHARVFTWSGGSEVYSLAVPKGVVVAEACGICHRGPRTYIRKVTKGM